MVVDRTYLAVRRQLDGMQCAVYDVGIRDPQSGLMRRVWSRGEVLKQVGYLKAMNAHGNDIFIRSNASDGLIFCDDLGQGTLHQMEAEGFAPAVVIESSPMNYHAWIRISRDAVDPPLATQVAKILAERYGGDPNSADWRHYGRLAGFTNRKPQYNSPYVLAHRCHGAVATNANDLLREAQKRLLEAQELESLRMQPKTSQKESQTPLKRQIDPIAFAAHQYEKLAQRYGSNFDESKADCMIASDLIRAGVSDDLVKGTLEQTSPDLHTRKAGHLDDYLG